MKISNFGFLITFLFTFESCFSQMADKDKMEMENKKVVVSFLQEFFGDKNLEAADKYISSEKYIQHNPTVADGRESLKSSAKEWFKHDPSKIKMDIRKVSADDNLVWVHMKSMMGPKGVAVVDIFRLEKGMIVEHWDVMQEIPSKSANSNSMF